MLQEIAKIAWAALSLFLIDWSPRYAQILYAAACCNDSGSVDSNVSH